MKTLLILILMPLALNVMAETKIVQPDLKLGLWMTTIDNSPMMDQALAQMPEGEDKAKARAMMQAFMSETTEVDLCITPDNYNDIVKSLGETEGGCKTDVLKSSRKKMVVLAKCDEGEIKVTTDFINSKRYESTMVSNMREDGRQQEITITGVTEWKAADCPANLASDGSAGANSTIFGKLLEDQGQRQKQRVESRAEQAEDRAADKAVDKVIDKIFGSIFN